MCHHVENYVIETGLFKDAIIEEPMIYAGINDNEAFIHRKQY